jgi:hypothetical protein
MDGQSSDTEKIGQKTKNEDMQNRETQHRKLKKDEGNAYGPHQKEKKEKKPVPKKKRFSSVCVSSRALS